VISESKINKSFISDNVALQTKRKKDRTDRQTGEDNNYCAFESYRNFAPHV